jgi:hypothetical protein
VLQSQVKAGRIHQSYEYDLFALYVQLVNLRERLVADAMSKTILGVSHGWASVRTSGTLGRYPSEIRTGCANKRPSGSVRGATSNGCPYRDLTPGSERNGLISTVTRMRERRHNLIFLRLVVAACQWVRSLLWSDQRKHAS